MNIEYGKRTDRRYIKNHVYNHANWYLRSVSGDIQNGNCDHENLYCDVGLIYFFGSFDSISYNTDYVGIVIGFEI